MIGTSLPLGVLAQEPNCEADALLLKQYGGIRALLAAFRALGVGAIELRSVQAHADAQLLSVCAQTVLDAGLALTVHAALDDMPADMFFENLYPALEKLPRGHYVVPLTLHSIHTGHEMQDRAATVRLLTAWSRFAQDKALPVCLALENNRIHRSGRSLVDCSGVMDSVRAVGSECVGVCFDFGHLYSNYVNYPECTPFLPDDDFLRAAVHTHIHALTHTTHYPLNTGRLPLEEYISVLRRCGYSGIYNLELEGNRFWREIDPRTAFEASITALRDSLAHAAAERLTDFKKT